MQHVAWWTSICSSNGADCMEVAPVTPGWRTASYSGNGMNCVEVAPGPIGVLLRDTKDHGTGPVIAFTTAQWAEFLAEVATDAPSANGAAVAEPTPAGVRLHGADGVRLDFTHGEWAAFRSGVRDGEFTALVPA